MYLKNGHDDLPLQMPEHSALSLPVTCITPIFKEVPIFIVKTWEEYHFIWKKNVFLH